MHLAELIDRYGYAAIVLGTFVEGETILVLGGFAAHQGYLTLPGVMLAAFVGSLAGDQLAYFLGRRFGQRLLERFPKLKSGVERSTALLSRHQTPLLLGFRFVYGIRNVTPVAAGLAHVPVARFVLLNVAGAALWSIAVSVAGYVVGRGFVSVLERAREFEEHAFLLIAALGVGWFLLHRWRRKRDEVQEP
ncbi:MAG: DedA family protein [Polyangiaceae bacterium]